MTHWSIRHLLRRKLGGVFFALILGGFAIRDARAQVGLPPVIIVQPLDQVVLKDGTVTFLVVASSLTTMTYTWYKNGAVIPGANAASHTISGAQLSDAGGYRVEVTNPSATTSSRTATLTVLGTNDPPVASNDVYSTVVGHVLTVPSSGVLSNDYDNFPGSLTATLLTHPTYGRVVLSTNGSFVYMPVVGYIGTDTFTYRTEESGTNTVEENAIGGRDERIDASWRAQSFRHGTIGDAPFSISKVVLHLSRRSVAPNVDLNFSIGTQMNGGTIPGSQHAITMASITNLTEGNSFQRYEIALHPPLGPLAAGSNYFINLENLAGGKEVFVERADSSTYARGTMYKDYSDEGRDIRFEIQNAAVSAPATVRINVTSHSKELRFVSQSMTPGGMRLELNGPTNASYIFLTSMNSRDWKPVWTNYTASGSLVWTDAWANSASICLYRAKLAPAVLQQQATSSGRAEIRLGRKGAQSFRHGVTGGPSYTISKVVLQLSRESTPPNTNLNFSIGTGVNSGAIAGSSVSIPPASITAIGSTYQTYEIVFPTPVGPLNAGTHYFLNLDAEASNGKKFYHPYGGSSTYTNGTYYRNGSVDSTDMWFQIWGE